MAHTVLREAFGGPAAPVVAAVAGGPPLHSAAALFEICVLGLPGFVGVSVAFGGWGLGFRVFLQQRGPRGTKHTRCDAARRAAVATLWYLCLFPPLLSRCLSSFIAYYIWNEAGKNKRTSRNRCLVTEHASAWRGYRRPRCQYT